MGLSELVQRHAVDFADRDWLVQTAGPARASTACCTTVCSSCKVSAGLPQPSTGMNCANVIAVLAGRRGGQGRATPLQVLKKDELAPSLGMERDGGMGNGLGRRFHHGLRQHVLG
jgi:hypothetical protein